MPTGDIGKPTKYSTLFNLKKIGELSEITMYLKTLKLR